MFFYAYMFICLHIDTDIDSVSITLKVVKIPRIVE